MFFLGRDINSRKQPLYLPHCGQEVPMESPTFEETKVFAVGHEESAENNHDAE